MPDQDISESSTEHVHVYEITGGSGGVYGADCSVDGRKAHLCGANGAVLGGKAKIRAAIEEAVRSVEIEPRRGLWVTYGLCYGPNPGVEPHPNAPDGMDAVYWTLGTPGDGRLPDPALRFLIGRCPECGGEPTAVRTMWVGNGGD